MEALVQWATPAPLWTEIIDDPAAHGTFRQPSILRFGSDSFMDDFLQMLRAAPHQISGLRAQRETWRAPMLNVTPAPEPPALLQSVMGQHLLAMKSDSSALAQFSSGAASDNTPDLTPFDAAELSTKPLKLYQPAHQRFYLVSACLVCRVAGLPDRTLNTGAQEKVSFVVRRLRPPNANTSFDQTPDSNWQEYAFVGAEHARTWQLLPPGSADALVPGEEQMPLFGVSFTEAQRKRRLFAGNIPVAKRETYMGARMALPAAEQGSEPIPDPRLILLRTQALDPWQRLIDQCKDVKDRHDKVLEREAKRDKTGDNDPKNHTSDINAAYLKQETDLRKQTIEGSWYILLDFADVLTAHFPKVWAAIKNISLHAGLQGAQLALFDALDAVRVTDKTANITTRLTAALAQIGSFRSALETNTELFDGSLADWPNFKFPLADPSIDELYPASNDKGWQIAYPAGITDPGKLLPLFSAALEGHAPKRMPATPTAAQPMPDGRDPGWFVIRCVFERPHCGPLCPTLVSVATAPFQMASFFDPDAPARPIRIALPIDTSPGGLRKFNKNTALLISDTLNCQMQKVGKLTLGDLVLSILPWPFHQDLPTGSACEPIDMGLICSISIPIITICALILLMIIVSLLDMIFHWMPFFILCFPFPKFKAKKS